MHWSSWTDFFSMGERGFFVWGSYGVALLYFVIEIIAVRHRKQAADKALQQSSRLKRLDENESQT